METCFTTKENGNLLHNKGEWKLASQQRRMETCFTTKEKVQALNAWTFSLFFFFCTTPVSRSTEIYSQEKWGIIECPASLSILRQPAIQSIV
jgi:hypothetical protein